LIVASPANPTGTVLGPDALGQLARYCGQRGIRLISDEIYHGIGYGAPIASALAYGADAVVINSFSKYYSMTGWRIGWMVLPQELVRPIECLAQNLFHLAAKPGQQAAIAAFGCRTSSTATSSATAPTAGSCWTPCPRPASRRWLRPTGPSTSMPMSAASPMTARNSAGAC